MAPTALADAPQPPAYSDGVALLRAILEDPADDVARLVYADWLDENAPGGEARRAEFIRKQIRMMRMPGAPEFDGERHEARHWLNCCIDNGDPALWIALELDLAPYDWHWSGDEAETQIHTAERVYTVSRGFVSRIELTGEAFVAHAKAIFSSQPVTSVRLVNIHAATWHEANLALWLHTLTDEGGPITDTIIGRESQELSSRACVAFGRHVAGLSPLVEVASCPLPVS